ncbi:O-antigen ligase family protein [Limisalsivibrio acetivorans]|uniref:O-antigen ligase family protein n=1 Tax=Limisalsivibrio acetivorans TaxID=1304888 RepID=UPI0003B4EE7C|nr:O-antigen ligase family protein [Limisalsivibrio acetivorans]
MNWWCLVSISHSVSISSTQIILGGLLFYWIYISYKHKDFSLGRDPLMIALGVMFITGLISVIAGPYKLRAAEGITNYWIFLYLFAGIYYIKDTATLKRIYYCAALGGAIISVTGLYQTLVAGEFRAEGFYSHPLTFANVLTILITMNAVLILRKGWNDKKELAYLMVTVLLMFAAVLASGSRMPILTLAAIFPVIAVATLRWKGLALSIIVLAAGVVAIYFSPSMKQRFIWSLSQDLSDGMTSFGNRLELWKASWEMFKDRPLFGVGYKNFSKVVRDYLTQDVYSVAHAHNAYIQHIVLHGIVGFASLLAFLGLIIKRVFGVVNRSPYHFASLFILAAFLICGLTENTLSDSEVAMFCMFLVGSAIGSGERNETSH